MDLSSQGPFTFNYKNMILDEIALEGLEGIGFNQLCNYIHSRISAPITEKMKGRFWHFVVNSLSISIYKLQEPLETYEVFDRLELVHEESGNLLDPEFYLDGPYEYCPAENDYGSCKHYKTRALIPNWQLQNLSYEDAQASYGDCLVMVASMEDRWQALAPHMPISYLTTMTPVQYCILELIGKGRKNGQMTVGNTNLTKIVKEPKLMFYNKKYLKDLDFIRDQCVTLFSNNKSAKSLLIHLKRFHTPHCLPQAGRLCELVKYLLTKPDHSERTDIILRMGIFNAQNMKKLQKTVNMFRFEDRFEEGIKKKKSTLSQALVKKRYISLMSQSDDDNSQSDEETNEEPTKCQYKVGVNLLRQAYEVILAAGLNGLTQKNISQTLGIEFYTSRTICRVFKKNGTVREFLEDKGKQRMARYIAVAATSVMDGKFEKEKIKFMEYLNNSKQELKRVADSFEFEVPLKKAKTNIDNDDISPKLESQEETPQITEVTALAESKKVNKSFIESGKSLTLRQLRFANGLLKIVWERTIVTSFQTLSSLVAKEIGDTPMDTKSLKIFIQRLVIDGQLKILKIKWPGNSQLSFLICVPHIKTTDKIVRDKYKELCLKYFTKKQDIVSQDVKNKPRPLSQMSFPRYLRFQKLHEFIFDCTYHNKIENKSNSFPDGFTSLIDIIPQLTVRFALGNINNVSTINAYHFSEDVLDLKLVESPPDLYRLLIQCGSFKNALKETLRSLASLGLIQLIKTSETNESLGVTLASFIFYVNRHAKIIDTSGLWPRGNANTGTLKKSFYFETVEDVKKYWTNIQNISMSTTINTPSKDRKTKLVAPLRTAEDAMCCDKGDALGDGLGPCGFDSSFYMDIPRYWQSFYAKYRLVQHSNKRNLKPKAVKKTITKPKQKVTKRMKMLTSSSKPLNRCRRKKRNEPKVKWIPIEDKVITIAKAALVVMSPNIQPGYLTLRNGVIKDILGLLGTKDLKYVANAIHKRANTLDTNPEMIIFKDDILCLLKRHKNIVAKYEHSLKHIRLRLSANMVKYINEAKLVLLELIWIIIQLLKLKRDDDLPCVAENLEEFYKKFTLTMKPSINRLNSLYKTTNNPVLSTIKEGVIMSVMMSNETQLNKVVAKKIFNIFQHYPERLLRTAVDQLRKCSAISAREKLLNNHLDKFQVPELVRSSYKISFIYKKKVACKLNSDFVDDLAILVDQDVSQIIVKGTPSINCFLLENEACGVLDLFPATTPVISGSAGSLVKVEQMNVLDMEANYRLKSGTVGIKTKSKVKKYSEIYRDIDVDSILEDCFRNIIINSKCENPNPSDPIISYLEKQGEKGSTFERIQEHCGFDEKSLMDKLAALEKTQAILKVGYYENLFVLKEYLSAWSIEVDKQNNLIPMPWLTLEGEINFKVFMEWTALILDKVIEFPGSSITFLAECCDFLTAKSCQLVCEFLEKCKILTIAVTKTPECDLFSYDFCEPEFGDYNPYDSVDKICVSPLKDSFTKFSHIRSIVMQNHCESGNSSNT